VRRAPTDVGRLRGWVRDRRRCMKDAMTTENSAEPAATPAPASRSSSTAVRRRGWVSLLRDIVVIVAVAILVSLVVKTFLVRSFYIPSASMEDTLQIQDRILVDEITPRVGGYQHGDVVVFRDPGGWLPPSTAPARPFVVEAGDWLLSLVGLSAPDSDDHLIKRVIGVAGDHCHRGRPYRGRSRSTSWSRRTRSGCSETTATAPRTPGTTSTSPARDSCPWTTSSAALSSSPGRSTDSASSTSITRSSPPSRRRVRAHSPRRRLAST
jgi:signal peptidase I